MNKLITIIAALFVFASCGTQAPEYDATDMSNILSYSTMQVFMPSGGSGSAFVWDDTFIMTAGHCVEQETQSYVELLVAGKKYKAEIAAYTPAHTTDVALIYIPEELKDVLKPLVRSTREPTYLDNIILVGCPLGEPEGVTTGVVSHPVTGLEGIHGKLPIFFRTDTDAAPGNSGGAAVMNGKLVGMLTRGVPGYSGLAWCVRLDVLEIEAEKMVKAITKSKEKEESEYIHVK